MLRAYVLIVGMQVEEAVERRIRLVKFMYPSERGCDSNLAGQVLEAVSKATATDKQDDLREIQSSAPAHVHT